MQKGLLDNVALDSEKDPTLPESDLGKFPCEFLFQRLCNYLCIKLLGYRQFFISIFCLKHIYTYMYDLIFNIFIFSFNQKFNDLA